VNLTSNNSASYLTKALKEATQVVNLITESQLCNQRFKILFYETGVNETCLLFSSLVVMWQSTNQNAQSQKQVSPFLAEKQPNLAHVFWDDSWIIDGKLS